MLERVRNVIKKGTQDESVTPTVKRPKKQIVLYPVTSVLAEDLVEVAEDSESLGQHIQAMKDEMSKQKPRSSLLAPLMRLYLWPPLLTNIVFYPSQLWYVNRNLYMVYMVLLKLSRWSKKLT